MADFLPPRGDSATLFERVCDYIMPHDREFRGRCVGASPEQIAVYAAVAGFGATDAVPRSYHSYLRGMGRDDGGLFRTVGLDAQIDGLLELYDDWGRTEPDAVNPALPVAANYLIGDQVSFDRRAGAPMPHAEPLLADTGTGEWVASRAQSWEGLVMQTAALYVESRRLRFAVEFASSTASARAARAGAVQPAVVDLVDEFAAQHGLAPAWLSDERHRVALGADYSMFATVREGDALLLTVFSANDEFPRVVRDRFAPRVGARMTGTLRVANGILQPA